MFTTQLAAIVSAVALLGGWGVFKSVQVSREKKKNQALLQKNEQLKAAKAVAELGYAARHTAQRANE